MTPKRRTTVHILVAAVAGGVLWLVSGWAAAGITLSSTRYASALQLVIPPTIPSTTFYQAAPWNTVLPLCGAVGFAAALAVGYLGLDALTARRAAPGWARFLAAWLIAAFAGLVVATAFAIGSTLANIWPTGLEWAFREARPGLLSSALFGLVWGWAPGLLVGRVTSARSTASRRTTGVLMAVSSAVLVCALVCVIATQPQAVTDTRVAAGGAAHPTVATPTPTPSREPPPRVSDSPIVAGADWCSSNELTLTVSGTAGALGHRAVTVFLGNQSTAPCIVDGYPDLAFADSDGGEVDADILHGTSYMAPDPGASSYTLAPGTVVEAHVAWSSTGARDDVATTMWTAQYAGAPRTRLALDSDIVDGTTVMVSAWAPASAFH